MWEVWGGGGVLHATQGERRVEVTHSLSHMKSLFVLCFTQLLLQLCQSNVRALSVTSNQHLWCVTHNQAPD